MPSRPHGGGDRGAPAGQERVPTPAPAERGEPAKLISERGPLEDAIRLKLAQPLAPGDPAPKRDGYPYVAPLRELCVEVVAQNFVRDPRAIREPGLLDAKCVKKIVDVLPADLPLELAGELVADEDYWQRRAEGRWENPETVDHGRSWKQLYFERNLQEAIEAHVAKASTSEEDEDPERDALRRLLAFSKRWARSLKIVHAPGAVDLAALFECTAGSLVSLDLKYIARDVRDNYDGANTLGMRLGCARALAKALEEHAETLTHLGLSQNSIDDAKLEPLAEGLATNASVTSLDLSKNKIGCDGARVLARVLAKDACVVSRLDLGDNEIGASGAAALAKARRPRARADVPVAAFEPEDRRRGWRGGARRGDGLGWHVHARARRVGVRLGSRVGAGAGAAFAKQPDASKDRRERQRDVGCGRRGTRHRGRRVRFERCGARV